ncbi:NAD-dependent epimerase/dehydratase family protein [Rheinheimera sp.]|uniref:NAD-dependent epimerase/dehydratase family protein n=1 Tax=Rheinheimera sp. TaxID=1869214 RepID=UPI00307E18D3
MTFYVIGGRGRLGAAIASEFCAEDMVLPLRNEYVSWSEAGAADHVVRYLEKNKTPDATIFVASGILDPNQGDEELRKVNYYLPKNIIDAACTLGMKVVTFGTVMESLSSAPNLYVQSKLAIAEHVRKKAAAGASVTHIQLHTLYGRGNPSPFMFLGQVLSSLRSKQMFKMTSGQQLREYHHFDDDVKAIRAIIQAGEHSVVNLSHGEPVSLRHLAESIFDAFDLRDLLEIGALASSEYENFDRIMLPDGAVQTVSFRNSVSGVVTYLRDCFSRSELHADEH